MSSGFSPQELKFDGAYHALKVTLRNSANLTVQARRGYWAPNHKVDPAEVAQEEIQETVFSRDEIQEIPVDLQTEFFKTEDFKAELTVTARLTLQGVRFRKADDRNIDILTVVTGLFDTQRKLHLRHSASGEHASSRPDSGIAAEHRDQLAGDL